MTFTRFARMWGRVHSQIEPLSDHCRAIADPFSLRYRENCNRLPRYNFFWNSTICKLMDGYFAAGFPPLLRISVKFCTSSHFPFRAFSLFYIFPFGRIFTPVCHFVYAILFKSLRLLRLHLMQASALPSLVASITFGYYLDSGSTRAADNSVYAWHIYMFSPCFPLKFVLSCICFVHF